MPLNAQILLSILAHESSSGDISETLRATPASYSLELSDGTGANQAQVVWSDSVTQASQNNDIDLQSLSDDRGTVTFTAIKAIYIANTSESANVGVQNYTETDGTPAFSNPWLSGPFQTQNYVSTGGVDVAFLYLNAGGAAAMFSPTAAGYSVTASSKILRVNAAPGATYDIIIIGEGTIA